jgi:phospholipid-binding lipoprotein MlaA
MKILTILIAGALLSGCATLPAGHKPDPRDPWERFNRTTFVINDSIDRAFAKPVAKAYVKVVPRFVRIGVGNVFNNLNTINTVVNDVLQGKMRQAGRDSARFLLNSTVGLAGLLDPATDVGLELNDEDFGQTFGKWGMKSGPYLMLPLLGPTTTRDISGRFLDQFTYPVTYLGDESTRYIIRGVSLMDTRADLLDLDPQLDRAYDRYAFVRNAWLQRRDFQVTDGMIDDSELLEQGIDEEPLPDEEPAPEESAPAEPPAPTGAPAAESSPAEMQEAVEAPAPAPPQ